MTDGSSKTLNYEQRLADAADRMARRMGGQFVRDQKWENVLRAAVRTPVGASRN